ncbi:STAS-like domain-containing protein [Brevundimonas sp.]|uniref:STAS-like domain-containing protein n=1 Tax=Brevundimonas sp. TaxID=1871086 RepID=UPI0026318BC5|nr:STAS-like domain-containing protein [Brevundimonas sp.]
MATLNLAKDFSPYPAGRYPEDGPYNGEYFRDDVLLPMLHENQTVRINIDGVALLPSSFWEEIWGGMIRKRRLGKAEVQQRFEVIATDPDLQRYVDLASKFVTDAEPE